MKEPEVCVICGERPATTGQGDHIPPKSLYTKMEKGAKWQFHTVPACIECNTGASSYDEELKMLISIGTGEAREGDEVIDAMARTLAKNRRLGEHIFGSARKLMVHADGEDRTMVGVEFPAEPYARVIERIARAMYWTMKQRIVGKDATVFVLPSEQIEASLKRDLEQRFAAETAYAINGGTLKTKLLRLDDIEVMSILFFDQYEATAIFKWE